MRASSEVTRCGGPHCTLLARFDARVFRGVPRRAARTREPCAPQVCRGVTPARRSKPVGDQQLVEWPAACPVGVHANPHPDPALPPGRSGCRRAHRTPNPPDGTRIESAELSGIPEDQLSPGLRRDIDGLAGRPLARPEVTQLARRIEEERPDVVVAVRIVARPGDEARVIFLVARISDDAGLGSNINARYTVESVEIEGLKEARDQRRAARPAAGAGRHPARPRRGRPADRGPEGRAARLSTSRAGSSAARAAGRSASSSNSPRPRRCAGSRSRSRDRSSSTTRTRGGAACTTSRSGAATTASRWASRSTTTTRSSRSTRASASGSRPGDIGTERVAASLEASWLNNTWRAPTLAALDGEPGDPRALPPAGHGGAGADGGADPPRARERRREPVEPRVAAPLTRLADGERRHRRRWSTASGGTATAAPGRTSRPATTCGRRWTGSAATSDYTRHLGRARYRVRRAGATAASSRRCSCGGITGEAPLFERFTLGDSATLRGWNKFALAPAGGNRVFHQSIEGRFYGAALFLDAGSVWDDGGRRELRTSTGFGFHTEHVFVTVAFPLDAPRARRGVHDGGAVLSRPARRAWRVALVALACAAAAGDCAPRSP